MRSEASAVIGAQSTRSIDLETGPDIIKELARNTVFSQQWSISIWDEAQHLRSEGHLARAAHAIRVRSGSMVLCSATPLHNSERVSARARSLNDTNHFF